MAKTRLQVLVLGYRIKAQRLFFRCKNTNKYFFKFVKKTQTYIDDVKTEIAVTTI